MKLEFQDIKKLSLHDSLITSWELDIETSRMSISIEASLSASDEFGQSGQLFIENFKEIVIKKIIKNGNDDIILKDLSNCSLELIMTEEFADKSYEVWIMGAKNKYYKLKFLWLSIPTISFKKGKCS